MSDFDGEAGAVENVKDQHYAAMPNKSWEARNNEDMNKKMGYNNMADRANAAHPPTPVKAAKSNPQLSPKAADNKYDY